MTILKILESPYPAPAGRWFCIPRRIHHRVGGWIFRSPEFKTRTSASDLYAKGVTVCGKTNCIVLAPDDFKGTIKTSYDPEAWKKAEDEEGLVCLPASGYRDGTNVVNAGTGGYYWASTASYGIISSNVTFDGSFVTPSSFAMLSIGYPIRLVKE